ncbi:MAG: zeta toxin family protein [Planctomycetota bacterium]
MPEAVIIAGANGAGKTTFARRVLSNTYPQCVFINADEIQREKPELAHPFAAGREMLRRLDEAVERTQSFTIETTLASRIYALRIPVWKEMGFTIDLHFIEVPSAEFAVKRVAQRVSLGGHDIPEPDIRRRYQRGLRLFKEVYQDRVDAWYHWSTSDIGLELIDSHDPTRE